MSSRPALFTRELAAHYLSMSVREIDLLRGQGDIVAVGNDKRVKFKKSELDRYVDSLPERERYRWPDGRESGRA